MHENEVPIPVGLVRGLLEAQFPQWATLLLQRVHSSGTDNALFRLGDEFVVRMPRIDWAVDAVEKEWTWMPRLAAFLPVAVPVPVALGSPGDGYPWPWTVCRWLSGDTVAPDADADSVVPELAAFVRALRSLPVAADAPRGRGTDVSARRRETLDRLHEMADVVDVERGKQLWSDVMAVSADAVVPSWTHADLHPTNVLVAHDTLVGVLDFGAAGVADPAWDLLPAWSMLSQVGRARYRDELDVRDDEWMRGMGWAFSMGATAYPYYVDTNPTLANLGLRMVRATIDEHSRLAT